MAGGVRLAREREQLVSNGFCIIPGVLDAGMLDSLRRESSALLDELTEEEKRIQGGQGAWQPIPFVPTVFADLIAWPRALAALADLGFDSVRYLSGFIISREPRTRAAYWHQDWMYWDEPESADPLPVKVFLMYYLVDTSPQNGCLRVIPDSHRRRFPQHEYEGHGTDIRYENPDTSVKYADASGQIDVPIKAGDLLIGDSRVLHAPRANGTERRRMVLTMWYLPRWDDLSERMQASYSAGHRASTDGVPPETRRRLLPLLPRYTGTAGPAATNRRPGEHLKP
ncbi:MAG: phytanoyl-CoA dioxygenase family protein [Spirochaetaceae bacterium]|nr:phytanoyl-CoA dioxygenase family protein [Spirochaetaceae bacterium]